MDAAISKQLPTQTTYVNQRPPPPPVHQHRSQQHHFAHQLPQQSQHNPRSIAAPNDNPHFQHHTQTNFIPNFAQPRPQPPPQSAAQHTPFTGGPQPNQQLSQEFHQQPLNQRSIQGQFSQQQLPTNQKPFFPSIQLTDAVLPTPVAVEEVRAPQFAFNQPPTQTQAPLQPVYTSQQLQTNQYFNPQQQLPAQQQQQQFVQTQFNNAPQFVQSQHQQYFSNPHEDEDRIREKQKIIQKHEQFVQKQFEKQQGRVRQQHDEFLQKQRQIKEQSPSHNYQQQQQYSTTRGHLVQQAIDADAFQKAVKQYQIAHPTTPLPTTTMTTTTTTTPRPAKLRPTKSHQDLNDEDLERFLKLHRQKLENEQEPAQKPTKKSKSIKSTKALGKDDLLKQLKLALAENPQPELGDKLYDSMDIVLPDGQKVQVIRTTDPKLIEGASPLSPEKLVRTPSVESKPQQFYDELTAGGLLPSGANFEVIKQSEDGSVQSVKSIPPQAQKKVTFVYLEEQLDGSFKVQGVKSNGEKEAKTSGAEVDSIVNRINSGDIKLPPSSKTTETATATTSRPASSPSSTVSSVFYPSSTSNYISSATPSPTPQVRFGSSLSPYSTVVTREDDTIHLSAASSTHYPSSTPAAVSTFHPSQYASPSSSPAYYGSSTTSSPTTYDHSPSSVEPRILHSSTNPLHRFDTSDEASSSTFNQSPSAHFHTTPIAAATSPTPKPESSTTAYPLTVQGLPTSTPVPEEPSELSNILKSRGLHAMAKYLRQSGLDSILNETGPYTVFAPTDKAFKSLLVQLGGPERAEEKFKTNPRLLSGVS